MRTDRGSMGLYTLMPFRRDMKPETWKEPVTRDTLSLLPYEQTDASENITFRSGR